MQTKNKQKKILIVFLIVSMFFGGQVYAHVTTDIHSGFWPSYASNNLSVAVGTSAQSYLSMVQFGSTAWNGIEPALKFNDAYVTSSADSSYFARVNVRGVDLGATGSYADAGNYKYIPLLGYFLNWDSEWKSSIIRLNVNTDENGNGIANLSPTEQQETITHEFGHVAGLRHNKYTIEDPISIMRQYGFNLITVPLDHDIAMIQYKY